MIERSYFGGNKCPRKTCLPNGLGIAWNSWLTEALLTMVELWRFGKRRKDCSLNSVYPLVLALAYRPADGVLVRSAPTYGRRHTVYEGN